MKTISKDRVKLESYALERELEILKSIDHPNIVRFYETYEDDRFFHIVTEYCRGGDLLDRAISQGMDEQQCSLVMEKLLSAVQYLHENGIVHRDIKPENCLFVDEGPKAEIKLIDFGLSCNITPGVKLTAPVGTPIYVAPEVLKQSYDHRCDYWSLGVIIYVLLGGEPPFDGESNDEIFEKILGGKLSFEGKKWGKISSHAKDLIRKLLEVDPEKRYTAAQALNHPWMKQVAHPKLSQQDALQVLTNLKGFTAKKRFSREILNTIVSLSTEEEIKKLREVFQHIDHEHHGIISVKDFHRVAKELGFTFTPKEIESMLSRLQLKPHDNINYTEFIIGAMDTSLYLTKEKLWTAFKHFSSENADYITAENLTQALIRSGKDVTVGEIEMMISEADPKHKGKITFEDFCLMISKDLGTRDSFGDITRFSSSVSSSRLQSQIKFSQCKFPNFVHSNFP